MATAAINILAHQVEPDEGSLLLHSYDLSDARESLRVRWVVQSKLPLVSALEANRTAILALIRSSEQILGTLLTPEAHHDNDRPEDCLCPACKAQVEGWAQDYRDSLGLDPADHPKANPMSERELASVFGNPEF